MLASGCRGLDSKKYLPFSPVSKTTSKRPFRKQVFRSVLYFQSRRCRDRGRLQLQAATKSIRLTALKASSTCRHRHPMKRDRIVPKQQKPPGSLKPFPRSCPRRCARLLAATVASPAFVWPAGRRDRPRTARKLKPQVSPPRFDPRIAVQPHRRPRRSRPAAPEVSGAANDAVATRPGLHNREGGFM